ncbi:MAG: hypothetical protein PHR56_02865 [Dehalococcoidales bacterium]|nr:hypothetical protein [Dehalococcoidales bacterium]
MAEFPVIDRKKCNGCGLCLTVCKCRGLFINGKTIDIVTTVECNYCTRCEVICPTGAISCPYEIIIEK